MSPVTDKEQVTDEPDNITLPPFFNSVEEWFREDSKYNTSNRENVYLVSGKVKVDISRFDVVISTVWPEYNIGEVPPPPASHLVTIKIPVRDRTVGMKEQ